MAKKFDDYSAPEVVEQYKKVGYFRPSGHEIIMNYLLKEKANMGGMKDKGGKPVNMKKANSGTGKKAGG